VKREVDRRDRRAELGPGDGRAPGKFVRRGGVALEQHRRKRPTALGGEDHTARNAVAAARELELARAQGGVLGDSRGLPHPESERLAIAGKPQRLFHGVAA
jgi:hypothetical protein